VSSNEQTKQTETKIYTYCRTCLADFSDFFRLFKRCPLCHTTKNFGWRKVTGENLPKWLPRSART
jgi:hypothetical protein